MRVLKTRRLRTIRLKEVVAMIITAVGILTLFTILTETSSAPSAKLPSLDSSQQARANMMQRQMETQRQQKAQIDQLTEQIQAMEKKIAEMESARKTFPTVQFRNVNERKRILITGGAGFVGSHLTDKLMMEGHEVRRKR